LTLNYYFSFGYVQLKSEKTESEEGGEDEEAISEKAKAKQQQSCLNCIGKIERKVKILPSSVHGDAHARMSLKVTERYQSGAGRRQ
jgi:hypothetical protein